MKRKLKYEEVVYEMAVPASRIEIVVWLITFGKFGRLFVRESKHFRKWMPGEDINCRCVFKTLTKE